MATLKSKFIGTHAYNLHASLSERVVVEGHDCHTALMFVSKLKKTKTRFLHDTDYLNSI